MTDTTDRTPDPTGATPLGPGGAATAERDPAASVAAAGVAQPGTGTKSVPTMLDVTRIMEMLPHRFPLLMIDRVLDLEPGQWAVGIKNVTINEPYFVGHFPTHPVMPGVLVVESMAQLAGVLVVHSMGISSHGKLVYFMSIEKAKFRKPIVPGDQVRIEVRRLHRRATVWRFEGEATVGGVRCAEAEFSAMLLDADQA